MIQFDKSINLCCLFFLTLEFSFAVYFLQLIQYVSIITYNQSIFCNNKFYIFFVILSDLFLSSLNNLIEILFIKVFLVDSLICLNISLIALKISKSSLSGSILINLHPTYILVPLLFLSFYFVVNISVAVCIFINFYWKFIVMKV